MARQTMTEDEYQQEFECSFEASVKGAIFGDDIQRAREQGRITRVPYDPALPVQTTWDLGIGDSTAIWFSQSLVATGEVRLIDYYEYQGEGLQHYALAHAMMGVKAMTIMGLAFMFSCFNVKPAAATILSLSFVFVNFILMNIPYFRDLQHWFLTYHLNLWQWLLGQPVPWWRVGQSLSLLLGFNLSFFVIGAVAFQVPAI